ncbi:hypothetical protein HPP92_016677 [Vanilla planifolia]|uniref:Peroxisomal ATPase PEX6 n=1 Tax=Vanilla planifolia TaxID=51239 RepID=A0A835QLM8_VANPL|nr:hypothetical protein HPP92_016677 [Vanilla planifolia]
MLDRRRPLILSSTREIIDSVLSSSAEGSDRRSCSLNCPSLRLTAGILRFSVDPGEITELDQKSHLIGVSSSVLRRLSVTAGSLVLVKNADTKVGRLVKILALDRPVLGGTQREHSRSSELSPCVKCLLGVLPSFQYSSDGKLPFYMEVAYVTPLLAFNLGLHLSSLKVLLLNGGESLKSLVEVDEAMTLEGNKNASVVLELVSWTNLPKYASHLRISFVKLPECGILASLKGCSVIEAEDRQNMIDSALNDYFKVDRYLTREDVFCVRINWSCHSEWCAICSDSSKTLSNNLIYFKVVAMEPSGEPTLRINSQKTALILGGTVASAIPPDFFIQSSREFVPLQIDTMHKLVSILAPTICPSVLSSKFRVAILLYGPAGCGKQTIIRCIAGRLGLHVLEYNSHDLIASSERKAASALANAFNIAIRYSPSILLLRHFDVFGNISSNDSPTLDQVGITSEVASVIRHFSEPLSDDGDLLLEPTNDSLYLVKPERVSRCRVLLVAAAESVETLQPTIRRCFSHEISIGSLSETKRQELLTQSLKGVASSDYENINQEFLKDLAGQTSGFLPRDISALVADAGANFIKRINCNDAGFGTKCNVENLACFHLTKNDRSSITLSPNHLSKEDLSKALECSKKRNAAALGTPKVPNVKWEDVGGLEEVKKSILDTVQLPLLHKDLFSSGLRKRSGVLLYGPPGTGKTLLAKAVATECSLNFLSVKGPELINMYIGESEKNVRDIFQKARSARPCVIFFDELDSLAPARGASGDSGGVMDRVVSQMLAEIDGLSESSQDLFIIGASNRPDLIDPALLRPGRFDKLLYVGVNSDASYRERVLRALTRKFKLHSNVSLLSIAKRCPPNFTGADMYVLCADAWFHAAKRKASPLHQESSTVDEGDLVTVEMDDFMKVLGEMSPSISMTELRKLCRVQSTIVTPRRPVKERLGPLEPTKAFFIGNWIGATVAFFIHRGCDH